MNKEALYMAGNNKSMILRFLITFQHALQGKKYANFKVRVNFPLQGPIGK